MFSFANTLWYKRKAMAGPKPLTLPLQLGVTWIEAPKEFESATEALSTQQKNIIYE
jgi:hypothetical protein